MADKVAYQGCEGAYAHLACLSLFEDKEVVPKDTFKQALDAVASGECELVVVPVENSIAGRVADIHYLLPDSGLKIVGEYYLRVEHCLLGVKGAQLSDIKYVHSHVQALTQSRGFLDKNSIKRMVEANTAVAALKISELADKSHAAIGSSLAGKIYNLDVVEKNIEDASNNTTRFLILSKEPRNYAHSSDQLVTSVIFKVKNIPAALYKALGGFATNGVNITKLESYLVDGDFIAAQFYIDFEGSPDDANVKLAMEELGFFSQEINILGTYPAHPYRFEIRENKVSC